MKENLLHFIWRLRLFPSKKILGTCNERIEIISPGIQNFNAGPDFLNAKIRINDQLWAGNIELHVDATDWYAHHHEIDENYDAVILHVVWEPTVAVFNRNNEKIATLSLKNYIPKKLLEGYERLMNKSQKWINCEDEIKKINSLIWVQWTDHLFFERLGQKLTYFKTLLRANKNDWEATLFVSLSRNFGLKINEDAFHQMANSISFSILRKVSKNKLQLEALLFGQAGLLSDDISESYYLELQKEYEFLRSKFNLNPNSKIAMQFFRLRPSSFPTIRISQFADLYYRQQQLFSQILTVRNISDFYTIFEARASVFWNTHFTFETSSRKQIKKVSRSVVDSIILNTIIPLMFLYMKTHGSDEGANIVSFAFKLQPEENKVITNFKNIGVPCSSAYESQALLQLKKNYCDDQKCLQCSIGKELLTT